MRPVYSAHALWYFALRVLSVNSGLSPITLRRNALRLLRRTRASVYETSSRKMPNKLLPLEYPDRFEVRYVSANGGIRWNKNWINVSSVCAGEYIGLEAIDYGIWNVYFGPLKLGRLHERHRRIENEYGRLIRK